MGIMMSNIPIGHTCTDALSLLKGDTLQGGGGVLRE